MFTIDQIKAAHSKVKSGADFPRYISELRALGVRRYVTYLADGRVDYEGSDSPVTWPPKYERKQIAEKDNVEKMKAAIKIHQAGGSDYPTICAQAAEYGVNSWIVDLGAMTCTYYNKNGQVMIVEEIPNY